MEHAFWLNESGRKEYISIKKVKELLGEDAARREKYKCPSEKCNVAMITVFPKRVRQGAKEAHSDHFRARPKRHTENCDGDGERKDVIENQTGFETDVKPRHRLVKRGDYPTVYVKRARSGRSKTGGIGRGAVKGLEQDEPVPGAAVIGGIRKDRHVSGPETGHIRRIVEAYEDHPEERSQMELDLPECVARNYEDGFRQVDQAIDSEGVIAGTYIHIGAYHEHHISADNAIIIFFSQHPGDGRNLSVRIEPELEPSAKREEIKKLLARAADTKAATVYAFGRFQPISDAEYSIRIKAFGDLWITFSDDTRA
jgi:hypothetical protein